MIARLQRLLQSHDSLHAISGILPAKQERNRLVRERSNG